MIQESIKQINVRIPAQLHCELRHMAFNENKTMAQAISAAIESHLKVKKEASNNG